LPKTANKNPKKPGAELNSAPGFLSRIAAVCYDILLLLAVLFLATILALPFNATQAFSSEQFSYRLYLVCVSFIFYGWFWVNGGQTLGLRAWNLKLARFDGGAIRWQHAALRYLAAILSWACLGLGFFWCIFDKNRLCWHDYLSKTRLYRDK
jgi:uncharacterized RDD family membrane protein YckC